VGYHWEDYRKRRRVIVSNWLQYRNISTYEEFINEVKKLDMIPPEDTDKDVVEYLSSLAKPPAETRSAVESKPKPQAPKRRGRRPKSDAGASKSKK
jgi:hypothetical protein